MVSLKVPCMAYFYWRKSIRRQEVNFKKNTILLSFRNLIRQVLLPSSVQCDLNKVRNWPVTIQNGGFLGSEGVFVLHY